MHIDEFCWIYKKTGRNLDISESEIAALREAFRTEREEKFEAKQSREKLLAAIFADKRTFEELPKLDENEAYEVYMIESEEGWQLEIIQKEPPRALASVNAGFGEIFLSKKESLSLALWLREHCGVEKFHKGKLENLKTAISLWENKRGFSIRTSLIRWSRAYEECGTREAFERELLESVDEETQTELSFFDLSVNPEATWKKHKQLYRISKHLGCPVSIRSSFAENGYLLAGVKKEWKGWKRLYEYR